jgi:hypothetical protein
VIVPSTSEETPFKLNTSRLGIDFEHNGFVLKITRLPYNTVRWMDLIVLLRACFKVA